MKDFFMAAYPWIIIGLCVAVMAVQMSKKRSTKDGENKENYMLEGMCLGMCLGANVGALGIDNLGIGMCMGMLIGEVIGMMIPKKKDEE